MSDTLPYKYISIEGNIGSGKTSLCELLARGHNCQLILEEFADNPFLPYFYEDPVRYAFTVELFFMTERHKQLQHSLLKPSLFADMFVSDYIFWKTMIFGRRNLDDEEYRLLQNLFNILNKNFPSPDLLVYLHRSPEKLLENIRARGRHYEQAISREYLQGIQDSYFEFFRSQVAYPILILEVERLDFVNIPEHYDEIRRLLRRKYLPGMHRIQLHL
jgi:deoxyadenosine/deoxycytidine kinase